MHNSEWIAVFRQLPPDLYQQTVLVLNNRTEITLETLLRIEPTFLAVRGRQSGGGGKASSFTARPIGWTSGVALAGTASIEVPAGQKSPPGGERGAWGFGKAKPAAKRK